MIPKSYLFLNLRNFYYLSNVKFELFKIVKIKLFKFPLIYFLVIKFYLKVPKYGVGLTFVPRFCPIFHKS